MRKTILLTAAIAAGAAISMYILKRKNKKQVHTGLEHAKRSHHVTEVFAKAKA